ncbi:hypothetical protein PKHYL_34780 [Psychrobacter sp. KH172YL61]|nr:hypothetical protein PKHYL_34780 [Psychrobacter sp. KH172YL61]
MTDSPMQVSTTITANKKSNVIVTTPRSIGFMQLWRREWQVKQQGAVQWLYPLVLFLVIITLFPLAVGSEPALCSVLAYQPCGLLHCCPW